jgi:hypothetical protein
MTNPTDWRALYAIAIELWDADCDMESVVEQMRTALAQPEPRRVSRASNEEVVQLCAWLRANSSGVYRPAARAADLLEQLTQPEPQGPTNAQIDELAAEYLDGDRASVRDFARAVLTRWGRPAIEPVPVAERPWEREGWCDDSGWCWGFDADDTDPCWMFDKPEWSTWTHRCPHWALPVPGQIDGR